MECEVVCCCKIVIFTNGINLQQEVGFQDIKEKLKQRKVNGKIEREHEVGK